MQLNDAWDSILARRADEAPGGEAPLNYVYEAPGYNPADFATAVPVPDQQQVVITAQRPRQTISIPILKPVSVPVYMPDPWDRITQSRAAMVQQAGRSFDYLPWLAAAAAVAAAALLLSKKGKRTAARRITT